MFFARDMSSSVRKCCDSFMIHYVNRQCLSYYRFTQRLQSLQTENSEEVKNIPCFMNKKLHLKYSNVWQSMKICYRNSANRYSLGQTCFMWKFKFGIQRPEHVAPRDSVWLNQEDMAWINDFYLGLTEQ